MAILNYIDFSEGAVGTTKTGSYPISLVTIQWHNDKAAVKGSFLNMCRLPIPCHKGTTPQQPNLNVGEKASESEEALGFRSKAD